METIQNNFEGINLSDREVHDIYKELGADNEGTIEFLEFLSFLTKKMKSKDSESDLREAFDILDEKRTGVVKTKELKQLLVEAMGESEDEVKAMFAEVDMQKSGEINIEDFVRIVLK